MKKYTFYSLEQLIARQCQLKVLLSQLEYYLILSNKKSKGIVFNYLLTTIDIKGFILLNQEFRSKIMAA